MADSRADRAVDERIAEFREWIAERRGDAGSGWANASEEEKLREIYWESRSVSQGLTAPGDAVLAAIEQNVDAAGLPAVQRELLRDIRDRLDSGRLDAPPPGRDDRIVAALERVIDAGLFEESLRIAKESTDLPWAGLSEDHKAGWIIQMARDSGAWTDWWDDLPGTTPGAHVLGTIEREVDYARLSAWRREGLEELRARVDAGEFADEHPDRSHRSDRVGDALRMVELEARIEEFKHIGDGDPDPGRYRRWGDMLEEAKLDEILREMRALGLESEPAAFAIAAREIDHRRLPPETRREFDDRLFDLTAADLRQRWYDDGLGEFGARWEDRPALAQVAYMADFAGAYGVTRERFAAAARPLLGLGPGEDLTPEQEWFVGREHRQAIDRHGRGRAERVEEQLRALQDRADFGEPANYEDFADGFQVAQGWVSIGRSWDRLTDAQKIDQIRRSTEFDSLRPGEKRAILARELALMQLPWEGRLESGEARAGSWPDSWGNDIESAIPAREDATPRPRLNQAPAVPEMLEALKTVRPYVVEAAILDEGIGGRLALDKLDAVVAKAERPGRSPTGPSSIADRERRSLAAYDAEIAEMTRSEPGEESPLARYWQAGSERDRLGLLADLAADHGVDQEGFVRRAKRAMGWPDPTAGQRAWMDEAWARAMDLDRVAAPHDPARGEGAPRLRLNHAADSYAGLMNDLEAFADEFARLARTPEQKALAKGFGEYVAGDAHGTIKDLTAEALRPDPAGPVRDSSYERQLDAAAASGRDRPQDKTRGPDR